MNKDFIEDKIKSLLGQRIITKRIEFKTSLYVYSKEHVDDEWSGPPLYINKTNGQHQFLHVADIINGHDELNAYFDKRNLK